jgi:hypothetical protein
MLTCAGLHGLRNLSADKTFDVCLVSLFIVNAQSHRLERIDFVENERDPLKNKST